MQRARSRGFEHAPGTAEPPRSSLQAFEVLEAGVSRTGSGDCRGSGPRASGPSREIPFRAHAGNSRSRASKLSPREIGTRRRGSDEVAVGRRAFRPPITRRRMPISPLRSTPEASQRFLASARDVAPYLREPRLLRFLQPGECALGEPNQIFVGRLVLAHRRGAGDRTATSSPATPPSPPPHTSRTPPGSSSRTQS